MAHVGTFAILALAVVTLAPHTAYACSTDAGIWAPPPATDAVSTQVPSDGALVVHLICTNGPSCEPTPRTHAVGNVRAPDGGVVPGSWRTLANDVLAFAPTSSWSEGAGYSVEFTSRTNGPRTFDVVSALGDLPLSALAAQLALGDLVREGDPASQHCCDSQNSCGASCYTTRQIERAQLLPQVQPGALSAQALAQLEFVAQRDDDAGTSSCVGCTGLPALRVREARSEYCVEFSARAVRADAGISIGRACTDAGYAALRTLDTPASEILLVCADAAVGAQAPDDAGVPHDAASVSAPDADARTLADAANDTASADDQDPNEPASADTTSPENTGSGCSALAHGQSGTIWLLPLALCITLLHRRRGPPTV